MNLINKRGARRAMHNLGIVAYFSLSAIFTAASAFALPAAINNSVNNEDDGLASVVMVGAAAAAFGAGKLLVRECRNGQGAQEIEPDMHG